MSDARSQSDAVRFDDDDAPVTVDAPLPPRIPGGFPPPFQPQIPAAPRTARENSSAADFDRIRPLFGEIRARMADMNEREYALRRREYEIEQAQRQVQKAARTAAESELHALRRSLEERTARLETDATSLERRARELTEKEGGIERRARELDLLERELERARGELKAARARLEEQHEFLRSQRAAERAALQQRIEVVRGAQAELEQRVAEERELWQRRREELAAEQQKLEAAHAELEQQRSELEASRARVRQAENDLQLCISAVEDDQLQLEQQRQSLAAEQAQLRETQRALDAERGRIREQDASLQARERDLAESQTQQDRLSEELLRRDQELRNQREVLAKRRDELDGLGRTLDHKADLFATREAALRQSENELQRQRRESDELAERLAQQTAELEQQRDELYEFRTRVESREAEARQAAAALEIERHEVDTLRVRLEQRADELERLRQTLDTELDVARTAVAREARRVHRAARSIAAAPRLWWLRGLGLATVLGGVAYLGWLQWEQPRFRNSAVLELQGAPFDFEANALHHRAALLDPATFAAAFADDPASRQAWNAVADAAAMRVETEAETATLRLVVDADRAMPNLLEAALRHYAAQPAPLPLVSPPGDEAAWAAQFEQRLARDLERVDAERATLVAQLQSLPPAGADPLADLERLRTAQRSARDELRSAQNRLTALAADATPRGVVDEAELAAALQADEMFQQDQAEFGAISVQYRAELAAAWNTPLDPARAFAAKLRDFRRVLDEQRTLSPPDHVARVIENAIDGVEGYLGQIDAFAEEWREAALEIDRLEAPRDTMALLAKYEADASLARKTRQGAEDVLRDIRTGLDEIQALGGGSTREVVVLAVIRGEFNALFETLAKFVDAVSATELTENFQLDALDRQVRSLSRRLAERPATLRQQLQLVADQRAQAEHARQLAAAREELRALEQQRDELSDQIITALTAFDQQAALSAQRRQLEGKLALLDAQQQRWRDEIARLPAASDAESAPPRPIHLAETLVVGPATAEQVAGADRIHNASLAGAGAFALTWLCCFLMVVRSPLSRGRDRDIVRQLAEPDPAPTEPWPSAAAVEEIDAGH